MYICGGPCIAMEGHVQLCRAMYTYGGRCTAMGAGV